jgi:hypothetical protein
MKEVIPVSAVLVLNADLGPLHRVSLRHALRMLFRQVAEVHEAEPDRVVGIWPMPKVVRLVRYVVTRWRYAGPRTPSWPNRQRHQAEILDGARSNRAEGTTGP